MTKCNNCQNKAFEDYGMKSLCKECYRDEVIHWIKDHVNSKLIKNIDNWSMEKLEKEHIKYSEMWDKGEI